MRLFALGILSILSICLAGCATLTKGTTQKVAIDTPGAPGANCTLKSSAIGEKVVQTPATIVLDKSQHSVAVTCRKECFQDGVGIIASNGESMAVGNVLVGGVVGLGIDAASGALNKYSEQNQITMVPVPGCVPRRA